MTGTAPPSGVADRPLGSFPDEPGKQGGVTRSLARTERGIFKGPPPRDSTKMALYESIAFALFALVTVGSAAGVVLVRDVWHSALLLGVSLVSVAVFYVLNMAAFVATMQILVYVGGVLILITFAVMLTREDESVIEVTP
jgi:NADH-quinone oxidoreductase subunit J